ncbi:hypothetical protein K469DRAFT_688208 [Zopfia rhizophila CBS 207.26]|uniref:Protein kinase domain-containing protein n=1 Tax=Zopfia rhizophila CBS 207.26 TaxID=1314779 RepID=A0A6A6E3A4_9PEZI|nr:hypothetical protein K469DRAFT_688208 [Zopfia rhizophila CBS 207.26]
MDGKRSLRAYAGYSFPKPAIATSNNTLKRTMIIFRSLFGRGGAGRLLNPSHIFTITLCDFSGSTCEKLSVDGKQLSNPGFFNPNAEWMLTMVIDIFSVGSVLYSIISGHWPHRDPGPFKSAEDYRSYDERVEEHFRNREYPNVNGLFGGTIILGC